MWGMNSPLYSRSFIFMGKIFFDWLRQKMIDLSLFMSLFICSVQISFSSTCIPRKVTNFWLYSLPHWVIWCPPINRVSGSVFLLLFFRCRKNIFCGCKVSLLEVNQLKTSSSLKLRASSSWYLFLPLHSSVVSSANREKRRSLAFGRSFMNSKNSRGPRMEPCGTPKLMESVAEVEPLTTFFESYQLGSPETIAVCLLKNHSVAFFLG